MKHPMIIKMIMRRYRVTSKYISKKLGMKDGPSLSADICSETLRIDHMVTILDALGYQLVFRPKGSGPLPEWSYPIRWSDYQTEQTEE